jgi:GntR family transcriptional regulator
MTSSASTRAPAAPGDPASLIRRGDPLPFYVQLAGILRDEIGRGRWKPGDVLPSEGELQSSYRLSRTAVRQALGQLVSEGLVQKEKGRGTFVRRPPLADLVVQELRGFYDEMTDKGHAVTTRILSQEISVVPPRVAGELGVRMGSQVLHLVRLRSVDGVAICEVETFLPLPRFERLQTIEMTYRSLYSVLSTEFGITPSGGHRFVEAELAPPDVAANLGVHAGDPLLKLVAVNLDQSGTPFEFFNAHYRGDSTRFELFIQSNK